MKYPKPLLPIPTMRFAQMTEVERLMAGEYGISAEQVAENAGLCLAEVAREAFLHGNCRDKGVVILAGPDAKGAAALVCARRLHGWGAKVVVSLGLGPQDFEGTVAEAQLHTLQRMGVFALEQPPQGSKLIIDGLLGPARKAPQQSRSQELMDWTNQQIVPVLALTLPSGVDPDTGAHNPTRCIRASATLALALPLEGTMTAKARPMVGEVYLADISVPRTLWAAPGVGIEPGLLFAENSILKVR